MNKKPLIVANWKLNHNKKSTKSFLDEFMAKFISNKVDVAIAPVATLLDFASQILDGSSISLAAQNVYYQKSGAFTGEYSVDNLKELNVSYCIIGHSERRKFFYETDLEVNKKALACLHGDISPIICIGETLEQRKNGDFKKILQMQCQQALVDVSSDLALNIVFAYEPIWAIGTGLTATLEQILEVHAFLRKMLSDRFSDEIASKIKLLYGGSVNNGNVASIISLAEVDGVLVGGASLQADSFLIMVDEASSRFLG